GEEAELAWAPDSRRLAYMSNRTGTHHIFVYDFSTGRETQVTSGAARNDPPSKEERLVATGVFDTPPFIDARDFVWSPDSRFIAYLSSGAKVFTNVYVAPVAGGGRAEAATATAGAEAGKPVSFLANTNAGALSWSPDGTYLTFATSQRTEPGDVIRVDLLPRTPKFREDQFRD